jgi:Ca2+-binding EF-hand superfamily protein
LRVLDLLKITAPPNELQVLLRRYMDKGNVDEVNYVDFTEDVDNEKMLFGVGRDFNQAKEFFPKTQARSSNAEIIRNSPDDIEDILARIRSSCSQQRIRIGEFFRDFDKLRSGYITAAQFRIGLNMAKVPVSNPEFQKLGEVYKAPKAGEHIKWREFCDAVDEAFTKKGLEKTIDVQVGNARTTFVYGRPAATQAQLDNVRRITEDFTEFIRKNRLDAKSFFQDFDRHRHFKVSPKVFRQVLTALGFPLQDRDANDIASVYGNQDNEIMYAKFLGDSNCLEYIVNGPTTGAKSTYVANFTDFDGARNNTTALMKKIQDMISKDRVRLLEFFQDHDILRKGYVPAAKFRSTLFAQRINLTSAEFESLEKHFATPQDPKLVNYVDFVKETNLIFTDPNLEKDPTKVIGKWQAPSILDPKDVLNEAEERILVACLTRLGTDVAHRRLLIKPHF